MIVKHYAQGATKSEKSYFCVKAKVNITRSLT